MLRPIFYKEFIKIRWPWLTLAVLNSLLLGYIFLETRHLFTMDHAEIVWYRVIHLGQAHYLHLKYAPALTGLLLAVFQYLPEMTGERLKLSLHLPVSPHLVILAHVCAGFFSLGVILAVDMLGLAALTAVYFPAEVVATSLWTAFPWCLAGVAVYLGCTLALLEPGYFFKLFNLAVGAGVAGLFLAPADPGAYVPAVGLLALLLALMIPAVLLPAYRFRYRRVS